MVSAAPAVTPLPERPLWVRRAILLSWLTIAYNLVEAGVSMGFGWADESVALFGFGVDALIEVASAVAVLWRFRGESGAAAMPDLARERRATLIIGALFVLLALGTVAGAAARLVAGTPPQTTVPGVVVALVSLSFMFFLWAGKRRTAAALDSATVASDAACSLACIQLSGVLLVGSALFALAPQLWWVDAAAAIALAVLIGRDGVGGIRAARRPAFSGGCGCGHACSGGGG